MSICVQGMFYKHVQSVYFYYCPFLRACHDAECHSTMGTAKSCLKITSEEITAKPRGWTSSSCLSAVLGGGLHLGASIAHKCQPGRLTGMRVGQAGTWGGEWLGEVGEGLPWMEGGHQEAFHSRKP